jgi:hypothetical protein
MTASKPKDVELACRCGSLHGVLRGASQKTVNRCLCYCDDCQAFAHHLGRPDLLDAHGGSDIVQVAPAQVSFDRGHELLRGVRLSPKGMFRWFASCCRTPVGNTMTPSMPFVGLAGSLLRGGGDEVGPVRACIQQEFSTAPLTTGPRSAVAQARMFLHVTRLLLSWKLRGKAWPNPFFEAVGGTPRREVTVLTPAERDALRARCGRRAARA